MAAGITEPTGRKVGTTTVGATGGTALAGAIAIVLVWVLAEIGVDVPGEVQGALIVIIAAAGTLVGGKLTPSNQARTIWGSTPQDQVTPVPAEAVIPDGDGSHRATTAADELQAEVDAIAARAAASRQGGVA